MPLTRNLTMNYWSKYYLDKQRVPGVQFGSQPLVHQSVLISSFLFLETSFETPLSGLQIRKSSTVYHFLAKKVSLDLTRNLDLCKRN